MTNDDVVIYLNQLTICWIQLWEHNQPRTSTPPELNFYENINPCLYFSHVNIYAAVKWKEVFITEQTRISMCNNTYIRTVS